MNTRTIIGIVVVALLIAGAAAVMLFMNNREDTSNTMNDQSNGQSQNESESPAAGNTNDTELHPVSKAFIDAWNNDDGEAMTQLFTEDGVLIDAGRTMNGHDEIRSFAESETKSYDAELIEIEETRDDGQRTLVNITSGSGSGFRATFDLTIVDGKITKGDLRFA